MLAIDLGGDLPGALAATALVSGDGNGIGSGAGLLVLEQLIELITGIAEPLGFEATDLHIDLDTDWLLRAGRTKLTEGVTLTHNTIQAKVVHLYTWG